MVFDGATNGRFGGLPVDVGSGPKVSAGRCMLNVYLAYPLSKSRQSALGPNPVVHASCDAWQPRPYLLSGTKQAFLPKLSGRPKSVFRVRGDKLIT